MILFSIFAILLVLFSFVLYFELRRGRATFMQRPFERNMQPQAYWSIIASRCSLLAFLIWVLGAQLMAGRA
jgi:hypothetical protein